jgi:ABC-type amino acid transport system permease subunit
MLGMIAGKVKFRDEMLVAAAAVLIATPVWKSQGLLVGIAVGIAIIVGCGLLIRLRKRQTGAGRRSSDY